MFQFQGLKVWEKSVELAVWLVQIADVLPRRYQFSFGEQLRRCALSIPSNIAEATGRKTLRDSGNFYSISRGSVYEALNILVILSKLRLLKIDEQRRRQIHEQANEICRMLTGLIKR